MPFYLALYYLCSSFRYMVLSNNGVKLSEFYKSKTMTEFDSLLSKWQAWNSKSDLLTAVPLSLGTEWIQWRGSRHLLRVVP